MRVLLLHVHRLLLRTLQQQQVGKAVSLGTVKRSLAIRSCETSLVCCYFHSQSGGADVCKQLIKGVSTSSYGKQWEWKSGLCTRLFISII